jgi:hypothetical protein
MMGDYEIDDNNQILVAYRADDKWSGKLIIHASYDGFSGASEAWIDLEKVVTFANSLTRYPIESDLPIRIASGFGSPEVLDQELVALEVGPVGTKGQLGVKVHLASPLWPDDRAESIKDVRFEFLTTYQRMSTFSQDLSDVLRGTLSEAALGSEILR